MVKLTIEEVEVVNELKPKQTKIVMGMLKNIPDYLDRDDFCRFKLEKMEKYGKVSLSMGITSDNGLLRDNIHIIISKHGKINHADSNLGTNGIDYVEEYQKVPRMKSAINRFISNLADWETL